MRNLFIFIILITLLQLFTPLSAQSNNCGVMHAPNQIRNNQNEIIVKPVVIRMGMYDANQMSGGLVNERFFIRFSGSEISELSKGDSIKLYFQNGEVRTYFFNHTIAKYYLPSTSQTVYFNMCDVLAKDIKYLSTNQIVDVVYSSNRIVRLKKTKSLKLTQRFSCLINEVGPTKMLEHLANDSKILLEQQETKERKTSETSLDNTTICQYTQVEKDDFTNAIKIRTPYRKFGSDTPESLAKYYVNTDFARLSIKLRSINGVIIMDTKWVFQTKKAFEYYGSISTDSKFMLKLSNGEVITLEARQWESGDTNYDKGETVYRTSYTIKPSDVSKLRANTVNKFRIYWSKGYEDYTCENPTVLKEMITCIDTK